MSNTHHALKYPYIEHFYEAGFITFWFKLGPDLAAQLPLIVCNKVNFTYPSDKRTQKTVVFQISRTTETKFEKRQGGVFGVSGYVPAVYATMEQVTAKLHLNMPQALVKLKQEDDEEFGKHSMHFLMPNCLR